MPLISLVVILIVIGVLLWLVNSLHLDGRVRGRASYSDASRLSGCQS